MKKLLIVFAVSAFFASCGETDTADEKNISTEQRDEAKQDSANYTSIRWDDSTFIDLGKVEKGRMIEINFPFTNTGDKNLIITNVSAGCGCTIPEVPKEPFAPGKSGTIKARFDSKSQPAAVHNKEVFVSANTSPNTQHRLTFRVEVIE